MPGRGQSLLGGSVSSCQAGTFCIPVPMMIINNLNNVQTMKSKEQETMVAYEAPQVEVIEVEVEQGFAVSGNLSPLDDESWD